LASRSGKKAFPIFERGTFQRAAERQVVRPSKEQKGCWFGMRFEIDVNDFDVVSLLNRLIAITGREPWGRKFASLQHQLNENAFLRDYQIERHGLELSLRDLLSEQVQTGVFPLAVRNQHQYRLYAFSASIVRIYEKLSPAGRMRMRGMLIDGLKPDNNLLSLQHEITTAVHLVSLGFDVEFNDMENGSGVDFIGRRDDLELEVECKMFTGDLGRQIHKRKVLVLHHHLSGTIDRIYQSAQTGILIRVTIPDRLTCKPDQLEEITRTVSRGVLSGTTVTRTPACEVEVLDFPIHSSPFEVDSPPEVSREAVESFIEARLGRTNQNLMIFFSPRKRAVVVLIESAKADEVLKGIYRQLREACKGQFTKTRPGHLAVQFQDLTAEQMEGLARDGASADGKPIGLQAMTTALLQSANRCYIHSVAYRSHGTMLRPQGQPHALMEQGIGSFTRNPSNPHYDGPRLRPLH
jgi:hypothetical protein